MSNFDEEDKYFYFVGKDRESKIEVDYNPSIKFNVPQECALTKLIIPKNFEISDNPDDLYVNFTFKWVSVEQAQKIHANLRLVVFNNIYEFIYEKPTEESPEIINQKFKLQNLKEKTWFENLKEVIEKYNESVRQKINKKYPKVYELTEDYFNNNKTPIEWKINLPEIKYDSKTEKYSLKNGNFGLEPKILHTYSMPWLDDPNLGELAENESKKFYYYFRGSITLEFSKSLKSLLGFDYNIDDSEDNIRFLKNEIATYETAGNTSDLSIIENWYLSNLSSPKVFESNVLPIIHHPLSTSFDYLIVYCNIINNSFLNNKQNQILSVLPQQNSATSNNFYNFNLKNNHYITLKYQEFDNLQISVTNENNLPLKFKEDNLIAVISIRPKGSL